MLPIALDPQKVGVGLAGEGAALAGRLALLRAAGVEPLAVTGDAVAFEGVCLLYIAGLEPGTASELARRARAAHVLVNVEDRPGLCDFYVPAMVRRGDLVLTVSTGGRAPGLARRLREWLEQQFDLSWRDRVTALGDARARWRAEGIAAAEISGRTRRLIDEEGWLP